MRGLDSVSAPEGFRIATKQNFVYLQSKSGSFETSTNLLIRVGALLGAGVGIFESS